MVYTKEFVLSLNEQFKDERLKLPTEFLEHYKEICEFDAKIPLFSQTSTYSSFSGFERSKDAWKPMTHQSKENRFAKEIKMTLNKITHTNKNKLIPVLLKKITNQRASEVLVVELIKKIRFESNYHNIYIDLCLAVKEPTFKSVLLNDLQYEFQNKDKYFVSSINAEDDEARFKSRRMVFGILEFLSKLYLRGYLSFQIIHKCLLDMMNYGNDEPPSAEYVEGFSKMWKLVAHTIENKERYTSEFKKQTDKKQYCTRIKFIIEDICVMWCDDKKDIDVESAIVSALSNNTFESIGTMLKTLDPVSVVEAIFMVALERTDDIDVLKQMIPKDRSAVDSVLKEMDKEDLRIDYPDIDSVLEALF